MNKTPAVRQVQDAREDGFDLWRCFACQRTGYSPISIDHMSTCEHQGEQP